MVSSNNMVIVDSYNDMIWRSVYGFRPEEPLHVVASAVIVYASARSRTKKSKNNIPPLSEYKSARAGPRPASGIGAHHFCVPPAFLFSF